MKTKQILKKTKPDYVRITFPLNLDIVSRNGRTTVPQQKIDCMIDNFRKSAQSAIDIITKQIYPRLINIEEPKKGYCPLCYAKNYKGKKSKNELIYKLRDFKIKEYFNKEKKNWFSCVEFIKGKISDPICECIKKNATAHPRLRKFLLPSPTHNTPFDMTIAGKYLNPAHKNITACHGDRPKIYDSCLQKACEAIKSQNEINKKIQERIDRLNDKLFYQQKYAAGKLSLKIKKEREWNKSLDGLGNIYKCPQCKNKFNYNFYANNKCCNNCIDSFGKKSFKIIIDFSKKRALKKVEQFIAHNQKKLKREQNKIASAVTYKNSVVRLYEGDYNIFFDPLSKKFKVKIKDMTRGMMMTMDFKGQDNSQYMQKLNLANYIAQEKWKCETEVIKTWKKSKYPVYKLHFIIKKEKKKIEFTDKFMPMGIDLGIANLQTISLWDDQAKKPVEIKFYNGRPIRRARMQMAKIRRIISKRNTAKLKAYLAKKGYSLNQNPQSYKAVLKKMSNTPEKKFMNYEIHWHTNEIIKNFWLWRNKYKRELVVVVEDLLDIRENINLENISVLGKCRAYAQNAKNLKVKRFWKRKNRFITDINKWNYAQWINNLKYKLELIGIPLVVLPKRFIRMSSTKCNKCRHIEKENRSGRRFKCKKCGYGADADFNASVNIAKAYYDWLKQKDNQKNKEE